MTSAVFNDDARRSRIQQDAGLNGIDYLEVDTAPEADNQRVLRVSVNHRFLTSPRFAALNRPSPFGEGQRTARFLG
jgi:hypothetical protein